MSNVSRQKVLPGDYVSATKILYHYCSTEAFHAIVQSRSVRLSSLSLSNDSLEGRLVTHAIRRLAERDGLSAETILRLTGIIAALEQTFDGLGFCLSEAGDLLSQWRGYAADGTGIAIGFSQPYFEWLSGETAIAHGTVFGLKQVQYDIENHDHTVEPAYLAAKQHIDDGAFRWPMVRGLLETRSEEEMAKEQEATVLALSRLNSSLYGLFPKLFLLKSSAFREECEWRLLSHYVQSVSDKCEFRPAGDRIIPYRSLELPINDLQPIVDIVAGPRHKSPSHVLESFLEREGFQNVNVRSSSASYRR